MPVDLDRRPARLVVLALVVLIAFAPVALGQDEAPAPTDPAVTRFLAAWAARMKGVSSLRVRFSQTKTMKVLRKPRISTGLAEMKGERVHLVTRRGGRIESELWVGPRDVRILYPRLERLEIYPRTAGSATPFPLFGGDVEKLPAEYRITLTKGDEPTLTLVPRRKDASLKVVTMQFRDHLVHRVEQVSRRGDKVVLAVSSFDLGAKVTDADVTPDVPAGTTIVRPTGKR